MKAWLPALLPAIIAGAIVGLWPGYQAYNYVWSDARFCFNCHVHDYAYYGWRDSIHGDSTTCHDCHHQPLRAYIHEAWLMVTDKPKFPEDLHHTPHVPKNLCGACHLSEGYDRSTLTGPMSFEKIEKLPKVDLNPIHKTHLAARTQLRPLGEYQLKPEERAQNPVPILQQPRLTGPERAVVCADCHGGPANRGHNFSAADVSCVYCHNREHSSQEFKQFGCRACHFQEFLIGNE